MKTVKKIWKWFNQRKRNFGIGISFAGLALSAFAPDLMTPEQYRVIEVVGGGLAGWGWFHNVSKNSKIVKGITNFNNLKNK